MEIPLLSANGSGPRRLKLILKLKNKNTVCLKYNYRHKFRFLHTGTFSAMSKAVLSLSEIEVLQDKGAVLNCMLEFHLTFANASAQLKGSG
jgi:hypothetical protein